MIQLKDKSLCCGCSACSQACPKACIIMKEDRNGFLYPKIDLENCIDCGLCVRVCPFLNSADKCMPIGTYAAVNPNEKIRLESSSGGIFSLLAQNILSRRGIVFGARFNESWEVIHDYTDVFERISLFRGSKYVQSVLGDSFKTVKKFLDLGKPVLFTGTPCHIAGLKRFLKHDYDNLISVDLVCHGVPSPKVWREYLAHKNPKSINFRDKCTGWKCFSLNIEGESCETLRNDIYMRGFLKNLTLRPSCFKCKVKSGSSGSDITIADFWGISNILPALDDDKGVSLVLSYSERGERLLQEINIPLLPTEYKQALEGNITIERSVDMPKIYNEFWDSFHKIGISAIEIALQKMQPSQLQSFLKAVFVKMKILLKRFLIFNN